ncbi:hypothetical protein EW145_g5236 [Phellinidium pouzarii]|uniref:Glycosyl hydrolase family 30 TIM-barrel domain-containing protein n=1 Tax=Phellinidium pouzarii TaxID=167371 RepID=A0A4S4L0Q8_9AGAM|nr:hypothetical protein EW145_g5236 [Phellinidium pouzarii]
MLRVIGLSSTFAFFATALASLAASPDELIIQNDDPLIFFHGRWDSSPGTWWAGTGFKLNVQNLTAMTLNLGTHTSAPLASVGVSLNYGPFVTVNVSSGSNVLPLDSIGLSGSSEGNTVVRINSWNWEQNRVNLESIALNSGAELLPYTPSNLAFQFIGDSLSAGQYLPQGVDQAWTFLTGEAFKAEHLINAQPGIALTDIVSYENQHGMSFQFFQTEDSGYSTSPDHDYTTPWNFSRDIPVPDVVVIYLGANDNGQNVPADEFVQTYLTFLANLRTIYVDQPILIFTPWGWPQPDGTVGYYYQGSYQEVVNSRHSSGDQNTFLVDTTGWVSYEDVCIFPSPLVSCTNTACFWLLFPQIFPDNLHPTIAGHQKIAGLFETWFQRVRELERKFGKTPRRSGKESDRQHICAVMGRPDVKLTPEEAQKILSVTTNLDMPGLMELSLTFAIFKTFAIPSISEILAKSQQLGTPKNVSKRFADTGILISTWLNCPCVDVSRIDLKPEEVDPRGAIAIARVNWLHSRWPTIRWAKAYGWRELLPIEQEAYFVYWKEIGERMNIKDIPETMQELYEWAENYEELNMVPAASNYEVGINTLNDIVRTTTEMFGLRDFVHKMIISLLQDRVRNAFMFAQGLGGPPFSEPAPFIRCLPRITPHLYTQIDIPADELKKDLPRQHPMRSGKEPWYKPERAGLGLLVQAALLKVGMLEEEFVPGMKYKSDGYRLEELTNIFLVRRLPNLRCFFLRLNMRFQFILLLGSIHAVGSQQIYDIWATTWNRDQLFTYTNLYPNPINFVSPGPIGSADIVVDDGSTYQSIWGFGASLTDSSAQLLANLKVEQFSGLKILRTTGVSLVIPFHVKLEVSLCVNESVLIVDFIATDGANAAGLSYLRVPLGASDFSADLYSYDDTNSDTSFNNFNINAAPSSVFEIIKDIQSINNLLRVHILPWSPPGWMKTSGTMDGGNFKSQYLNANYLLKCVQGFSSNGITPYAVGIQNEPENSNPTYPTALLPVSQEAQIGTALRTLLNNNGFSGVKIIGYEHNWDDAANYPVQLMQQAENAFAGVSFHCYAGSVDEQNDFHTQYPQKEIYFTECSGTIGSDWWSDIKWYMDNLFIGAITYNAHAGLMWNFALDGSGYSMAQASKAILPKDVGGPWGKRIGVSVGGSIGWGLIVGAYVTERLSSTDWNRYSLVVLNWADNSTGTWNPQAIRTTIEFRGMQATYTFPVGVTTLWWYAPVTSATAQNTTQNVDYADDQFVAETNGGPVKQPEGGYLDFHNGRRA